jgi:uncharacterized protein (DUF433 family)
LRSVAPSSTPALDDAILRACAGKTTSLLILRSHPSLTPEAIKAALAYAADLAQERVVALPA